MSSKRQISDSDFTIEWLQDLILKETGIKASIDDFSVREIGYGRGFISQILIVRLTWDTESDSLPKSVAMKIPSTKQMAKAMENMDKEELAKMDEKIKKAFESENLEQAQKDMFRKVHDCEVAVYDVFRSNPPRDLKVPKCYYGLPVRVNPPHQGVLVFEDLSNTVSTTFAAGVTFEQTMELAEQIAHLHAYSLSSDSWKTEKIDMNFETLMTDDDASLFPDQQQMAAASLPLLKEDNPELFGTLCDDFLKKHCQSKEDANYIYSLNDKLGLPDILVHGDMHCQNLVFEKSGKIHAVIDWQVAHPGNIMEDLVRFFCCSVSADIRRNHWMDILKHYYASLEKSLGSKPPYSFDQVIESYKRCFRSCLICILMLFHYIPSDETMMIGFDKETKTLELHNNCKALLEDTMAYEAELN